MDRPIDWEIYRFELVFLNSTHNSWQLFQESQESNAEVYGKEPGKAFYRSQIQELLGTVRRSFEALADSHAIDVRPMRQTAALGSITLDMKRIRAGLIDFCRRRHIETGIFDAILQKIIEHHRKILGEEGLAKDSLEVLGKVFTALREGGGDDNLQLSESIARDLLSVLAIKREWDIFGAVLGAPSTHVKFDQFRQKMAWRRFFTYRISYPTPKRVETESSKSMRLLGYPVRLELCAVPLDADDLKAELEVVQLEDYYEYCHFPEGNEEAVLYLFYGLLVDDIQRGFVKLGDNMLDDVFVIVYPIVACGYFHFLQLYVSPKKVVRDGQSVLECWNTWRKLHRDAIIKLLDDLTIFKQSLRELLVQIRVSAFQWQVSRAIENEWASGKMAQSSVDLFCSNAHHLVAMQGIRVRENGTWCYLPDDGDDGDGLFLRWRDEKTDLIGVDLEERKVTVGGLCEVFLEWKDGLGAHRGALFKGTSRQRLAEQYAWLIERIEKRREFLKLFGTL